jgi:hypothetical protein
VQLKFKRNGKRAAIGGVVAVLLGATAAFAWFTTTGSGTGSAQTARLTQNLQIQQIGAGYSSLISSHSPDPYIQDQCFACASITKLGDNITLANAGYQQLVSVEVAFRNWNATQVTGVPITLSINNGVGGPVTDTETPTIPAAIVAGVNPSLADVVFNFQSQGAYVAQSFIYSISFDASGVASGLNVALSSSYNNDSVGSETVPGTLWVQTTAGAGIAGDFPACTNNPPTTAYVAMVTNCGPASANTGAYGTTAQVQQGNADVPAVQVNVVGGVVPTLFPGGPAQPVDFAITNPNGSDVHVGQVTTAINSLSGTGSDGSIEACSTSMYSLNNATVSVGTVPTGTTIFSSTGTSISMTDDGNNQNNCQGATVNLKFSSTS